MIDRKQGFSHCANSVKVAPQDRNAYFLKRKCDYYKFPTAWINKRIILDLMKTLEFVTQNKNTQRRLYVMLLIALRVLPTTNTLVKLIEYWRKEKKDGPKGIRWWIYYKAPLEWNECGSPKKREKRGGGNLKSSVRKLSPFSMI